MLMFLSDGGGEVSKRGREREAEISRESGAEKSRPLSAPRIHATLLQPRICHYNTHAYIHDVAKYYTIIRKNSLWDSSYIT